MSRGVSLRQRHRELTESAILAATAEIAGEAGFGALTMEAVADRAGVSQSTLYRYFSDRETLIVAAAESQSRRLTPELPERADDIADIYERVMAGFDEDKAFSRAVVAARFADGLAWPQRGRVIEAIRAALAEITDHLDPDEAARATAIIVHLASGLAWMSMADDSGLDGTQAGKAAAWAIRTLITDLRDRAANRSTTKTGSRRRTAHT